MPRPRVRPENRVRSSRACDSCKASKIRCNSELPCAACLKRKRPGDCTYAVPTGGRTRPRVGGSGASQGSTPPLLGRLGHPISSNTSPSTTNSPGSAVQQDLAARTRSPNVGNPTQDGPTEDQDSPSERFVTGSNGEKVYIGDTASLSFLDFLRRNLRPYVGATPFTDGERQSLMLDIDADNVASVDMELSEDDTEALFQSYCEASSALLHLFTDAEITAFKQTSHLAMKKDDIAALEMALAIGAQARASGPRDAQCAAMCFARAQSIAFQDMLAHPSLSMVRLFLLLAFFTLGASRQNAAFIYLGVASKAAIVLGLHQPMSWKDLQKAEGPSLRLRVWHSLCILDVLTSSILGRPCTVPRATRHDLHSLPLDPNQPAFNAVLKGAALLDDICRVLSRSIMIDVPTAEHLLENLRLWSHNLPDCLRHFSLHDESPLDSADRQSFFGKINVSSVYYFSVILVTRPFLIRHLMSKLRRRSGLGTHPSTDHKEAGLAQVCMSSALYMGELCRKTAKAVTMSELPLGNLCLFKTWTFGAGLILGFSIFAGETRHDFQDAFAGVREVLDKIGEASPQSRSYGETLNTFADTISAYRRQASHKARGTVDQYIDQILTIDVGQEMASQELATTTPGLSRLGWGAEMWSGESLASEDPAMTGFLDMDDNWLAQHSWDDVSMQFLDNFAVDYGTQPM